MEAIIFWAVITVLLLIFEAITVQLVTIWFAAGGLVALVASLFSAPFWLQIVLFIVVSLFLLLLTKPLVRKVLKKTMVPTNSDRVIGQIGFVTETINNIEGQGQVNMSGTIWTARSSKEEKIIEKEAKIKALSIDGVKLIVEPVENHQ